MNNEIPNKPTLILLLIVSGLLWLLSLSFHTYTDNSSNQQSGLEVLLIGWLAPLFILNFGWYANLFILYIFIQFFNLNKQLNIATLSLLILSHSSYLITSIILNENGTTSSVYGYGLGYILWFTSIYILVIAVGLRNKTAYPQAKSTNIILYTGIILLCINTAFSIIKSTIDYTTASKYERARLIKTNTVYKRGFVCTKNYETKKFSQPVNALEINFDTADPQKFLNDWKYLFNYYNDIYFGDYHYKKNHNKNSKSIFDNVGLIKDLPDAQLNLSFENNDFSAQLIDTRNNEILFDNTWRTKHPNIYSYTHYSEYDKCSEPILFDLLKQARNDK